MYSTSKPVHFGFDLGSISINTVVMDQHMKIVETRYDKCHGKPFEVLKNTIHDLLRKFAAYDPGLIAFTGTGGKLAAELLGGKYINEIVAQSTAVSELYPEVRTVIEMGGEDSKLIFMEEVDQSTSRLSEFELNTLCAAGTGSFLDQQSKRIGVSIEEEFGELALESENPPRIAGRCSVFAKSDMIHLQQIATPVHDIVAGLCFAVARNFISSLGRGKSFVAPVLFQGGVASNKGMVRAFRELLDMPGDELSVPEHHTSMGAIGALYNLKYKVHEGIEAFKGLENLVNYIDGEKSRGKTFEPLHIPDALQNKEIYPLPISKEKQEVYLGLDIGSLSTNVVLIDAENHVIARRYLPTASKPLDAIRRGMSEIYEEIGERVVVKAAGTTGSGRYLTGDFIGADLIRNEITAQATAAIAFDPEVDTIFEIGGQDSKYISIDNGVVVDFEMNKVCAAGTGSFLEEQAEKLKINIKEEFASLALSAKQPAGLGDRCTVFMESDLNSFQQRGVETDNLVAGLAYSIVQNYIQKVVRKKRVGEHILFQGGVTNNRSVVAAFEKVTGKKIHIPPHFDVTGAIGAAMLARDHVLENKLETRFKGFYISKTPYTVDKFTCKACSNHCEIRRVRIEGEKKALFYGGRCEKYELEERKGKGKDIPNLFEERLEMLLNGYEEKGKKEGQVTIGIPRGLMVFYQEFPFWKTFFEELGFRVVLSEETSSQTIKKSLNLIAAETCFPVEVMHGHIYELLEKEVDFVFAPFMKNVKGDKENPTNNPNCPWVQSFPFMVKAALSKEEGEKLLMPTLTFRYFGRVTEKQLSEYFGKKFSISRKKIRSAMYAAEHSQEVFEQKVRTRGEAVMSNLPEDKECLVIMGRSYNTGDPALNLRMVEKLINLDVLPIPIDFLPLEEEQITKDYFQMYWPNGQRILSATRIIARHPKLHAIYMGNFRCGPDSFLSHFVNEEMKEKAYMEIEIDEHSADAGMITRYEAFLDSLKGAKLQKKEEKVIHVPGKSIATPMKGRTLFFPYMNDGSHTISATCRSFGIQAESLPMTDHEALELGRKYTSGKECFPMICTTGSFLKKLKEPGVDPSKVSFFMPDHTGPCRFGQYNKFQRILFDKLGYEKAEIISPSNENSYEDISGGHGTRFRFNAWRGFVAVDLLRKFKQEHKPYELIAGNTERVYQYCLDDVVKCLENDGKELAYTLEIAGRRFTEIPVSNGSRKPIVAIHGEVFMRDNPFCSVEMVERLEKAGAETHIDGFAQHLVYFTYRYRRDSKWKRDYKGILKSYIQEYSQSMSQNKMLKAVKDMYDSRLDVDVKDMLEACSPYINRHYDGDPACNIGQSVHLVRRGISGLVNIIPFTCMPGTIVEAVSHNFKKDNNHIPSLHIAYDGQEDASIEMRLQAFMHQVYQYAEEHGYYFPEKVKNNATLKIKKTKETILD